MKPHIVYFSIGAKNLKMRVMAADKKAAQQHVISTLKMIKVEEEVMGKAQDARPSSDPRSIMDIVFGKGPFGVILAFLLPAFAMAQSPYVAIGAASAAGENIPAITYPWVEAGISQKNYSFGAAFGRSDLLPGDGTYWWEVKTTAVVNIGDIRGYGMVGGGSYFGTDRYLIEYGGGFLYALGNSDDLSIGLSNFDTMNYLSIGVSHSFGNNE